MAKKDPLSNFKEIPLNLIDRPAELARLQIDETEINELAASIKESGLKQPIEVTPRGDRFLIVFGDRRFLAHKKLKKPSILCRVVSLSDEDVLLDRALENLQRKNLTPYEEALQYERLQHTAGKSLNEIAQYVGKSPGVIRRRLDILRMPDSFQDALHQKKISPTVAEELWTCPDPEKREYFLQLAVEHGITRTIARTWVQEYKASLRTSQDTGGDSPPPFMPYEDVPIYRACDICRQPVEYKNVKEVRLCPACFEALYQAAHKS